MNLVCLVIEGIALYIHLIAFTQPFIFHQRRYIAYLVAVEIQLSQIDEISQRRYINYGITFQP